MSSAGIGRWSYVEDTLVPRLPRGSVVLNWSERRRWRWWWLSTTAFRFFGGSREFNPLAVVVREAEFFRCLGVHHHDAT